MVKPSYFEVAYVINPYMRGQIGQVNLENALLQWENLKSIYEKLGFEVLVLAGVEGLPDMVFTANQSLPLLQDGSKMVILSRMNAVQRQAEVPFFEAFYQEQGYEIYSIPENIQGTFEGMGDALYHPAEKIIWGGYGFRTDQAVYTWLHKTFGWKTIPLKLNHPQFYHLDTCLSILDAHTALICKEAFEPDDYMLLARHFANLIEVPLTEAVSFFACNAHCPDEKHVILQKGSTKTVELLLKNGFIPVEIDTTEFLKSGGSVFCMKMLLW